MKGINDIQLNNNNKGTIKNSVHQFFNKFKGYLGNFSNTLHNYPLNLGLERIFNNTNLSLQNLNHNISADNNIHNVVGRTLIKKNNINDNFQKDKNIIIIEDLNKLKNRVNNIGRDELIAEKQMNKKIMALEKELIEERKIIEHTQKKEILASIVGGGIAAIVIISLIIGYSFYKKS